MKKHLFFLSILALLLPFAACKKDKTDPVAVLKQKMIGMWIYDKYQVENFDAMGNSLGPATVYDYDDNLAYVDFKADGTQETTTNGQDFNNDTWEVINGSSFKLGGQFIQQVITINATAFVYKEEIIHVGGDKSVYTYTLKK